MAQVEPAPLPKCVRLNSESHQFTAPHNLVDGPTKAKPHLDRGGPARVGFHKFSNGLRVQMRPAPNVHWPGYPGEFLRQREANDAAFKVCTRVP